MHPQSARDILPSRIVQRFNGRPLPHWSGLVVPSSSRFLRALPDGTRFYVARTTSADLVEVMTSMLNGNGLAVGPPLGKRNPTTVGQTVRGPGSAPLVDGIARNGITSVSFVAHHHLTTVPVVNNVWFYRGQSNALRSITVHYANGRSQTITH